ncbi:hypothetical protein [Bacteroides ihuae]|uniref:hypothetical protein n=1 Tax=Bacteroides ihuae TaxID=1852362 RepID=UPI0008D8E013|nr:hypothetical protein [Bacteroides ihuae]
MKELDVNDNANQIASGAIAGSAVTIVGSSTIGGTAIGGTVSTGLTSLANAAAMPAAVKCGFVGAIKIASLFNPVTAACVIGGGAALYLLNKIK